MKTSISKTTLPKALSHLGVDLLLLLLWLWLYRPVLNYLAVIFTREEFRTNQVVLLGVIGLIAYQMRRGNLRLQFSLLPGWRLPALALALSSSLLYLLAERFLDINTLSAVLFGLASYGFLGLWLHPQRWREGIPAAVLLIAVLPFGEHMDTFIGYPVRIWTASVVQRGFNMLGVPSLGVDTILVFENGVSQVDLPCSGIKSLWTGGIFLVAASWINGHPLNRRWLLVSLAFTALLLLANLARVTILIGVGVVLGWRLLASMMHVPLGVLGFSAACLASLWMLRWVGQSHSAEASPEATMDAARSWVAPVLGLVLAVMILLYSPRPQAFAAPQAIVWQFPPELSVTDWPLSAGEQEWLTESGVEQADRWRFQWGELRGSLLFITSTRWRAQHRPERCFQVYGFTIRDSSVFMGVDGLPLRVVSLSAGKMNSSLLAAYWFQSGDRITNDYGTRIWADLPYGQERRWVLVTILFDEARDPFSKESQAFYYALRRSIQRSMEGGVFP